MESVSGPGLIPAQRDDPSQRVVCGLLRRVSFHAAADASMIGHHASRTSYALRQISPMYVGPSDRKSITFGAIPAYRSALQLSRWPDWDFRLVRDYAMAEI